MIYTIDVNANITVSKKYETCRHEESRKIIQSLKNSRSLFLRRLSSRKDSKYRWEALDIYTSESGDITLNDSAIFINDIGQLLVYAAKQWKIERLASTIIKSIYVSPCIDNWEYQGQNVAIKIGFNSSLYIQSDELKQIILARHTLCKLQSDTRWL